MNSNAQEVQNRPNIIFILADDLGMGDVSCFNKNGKIATPNIDKIAENGILFTDAHSSAAVCTPTRYGFLTGRYNWRSRLKEGVLVQFDKPLLEKGRTNMASMLKSKGYQVVTQLKKATRFWPAEDYHQQYYEHKGSEPYCHKKVNRF